MASAVCLPSDGQVAEFSAIALVRNYAVQSLVWYCAVRLLTAFAVTVFPAVLAKLSLRVN